MVDRVGCICCKEIGDFGMGVARELRAQRLNRASFDKKHSVLFLSLQPTDQKTPKVMTKNQCRNWMKRNVECFLDDCNEVNCTGLAETAAHEADCDHWLDDETHWIWDLAVEVEVWHFRQ